MVSTTADAIIIGGGIMGASLAFHLSKRGLRSMVLERNTIASGATGYSSGLVRMHYDLELESRLAWESFQYFRNWKEVVGGDCGFVRTGFIQIVPPEYERNLRRNVKMHQKIGIPSLQVSPDDVSRLAPHFDVDGFNFAAYEPESGYADPSASTSAFLKVARQTGATLLQDCEVRKIIINSGKVQGVETTRGEFSAPIVINAAGAWAAGIGKMVGLEIDVNTWRHDTIFVNRPKEMCLPHPTVIDAVNSMYFRPETGALTLVGLEDDNPIGLSPENHSGRAMTGFIPRAVDRICERIPQMINASIHSDTGGFDGISPDQHAILGKAGPEGFFLACGLSGTGFKIAPAVGACMTELIVDGKATTVDISPFSPDRFSHGSHLVGEHAYENIWH